MASTHYVNNADFLEALKVYKAACTAAEEAGDPRPRVPDYVGECILKIANRLSFKPNFINYSYRDEMISDGIENCLQYIHNFDPEKSSNPFAYFTQIIWYAFLRRIQKEKKQSYIKHKMIQDMPFDGFETLEGDEEGEYKNAYLDFLKQNNAYDDSFIKLKEKKKKKAKSNLDEFME